MLRCEGSKIIDGKGNAITLRGVCLGAFLLQENAFNGFSGHEKVYRRLMLEVLGREKYDYFWDRYYHYFYADADARYCASLGVNLVRLAINYRHLCDDMDPDVIIEKGFRHIDRVIQVNAAHGIYTILDLHSAPGGACSDWHSDNNAAESLLWEYKTFQDTIVRIWEAIAERYKGDPWVAGYNLLNEPADNDPAAARLLSLYDRLIKAVRQIDPDHIIFLDGNTFGADFRPFDRAGIHCYNVVYGTHDCQCKSLSCDVAMYASKSDGSDTMFGFPEPVGQRWQGTTEQKDKILHSYERKVDFCKKTNTPIWVGEFGVAYPNDLSDGPEWQDRNPERYAALREQLEVYGRDQAHWTIWLYKDVGTQGLVTAKVDSAWWQVFGDFMRWKRLEALDSWGTNDTQLTEAFQPAFDYIQKHYDAALSRLNYPPWWSLKDHFWRRNIYSMIADRACVDFVERMRGMNEQELDDLAATYKFENCEIRKPLEELLVEFI